MPEPARSISDGDCVDPVLLHAMLLVPLPGAGTSRKLSPPELLARVRRPGPPSWARGASISGRLRLGEALARRGFDWRHRLDDRTLVARNPVGERRPYRILEIGSPGPDLETLDVHQLESAIGAAPEHDPGNPGQLVRGEFPARITTLRETDLPPGLLTWTPGPVLLERYRLVLVFDRLTLGSPSSSVTLLPGESRRVRHRRLSKSLSRESSTLTSMSARSADLVEEFRSSLEERSSLTVRGEEGRQVRWSVESDEAAPALSLDLEGSRSRSFERMTASVLGSIEEVERRRTSERESLRVVERSLERVAEEEREEEFLLKNASRDSARTWISYHVLAEHVLHLDLVRVEPLLVPDRPGEPFAPLPPEDLDTALLAERYGSLEIFEDGGWREALEPHPNRELNDRRLLLSLDARPRKGPPPVCLLSRRIVARTGFRFVRTFADEPPSG